MENVRLEPGFSNAGSRHHGVARQFLEGRNRVFEVANNVERSCIQHHRSNITCSARLRKKLYDSDDIRFSHFYDIYEGSQEFKL